MGTLTRPAPGTPGGGPATAASPRLRLLALALGLVAAAALGWAAGLHEWLRPAGLARLREAATGAGGWAPVLYVLGYVLAELLFVPAIPLTVLGGVLFGPAWGAAYASAGATLAAAVAFLIARHVAREAIARRVAGSPRLARMDAALARHGWRILVVTRLVPLFPFNLQNFAYGLTSIRFWTYVLVSWATMLPGTVALTMAGGALSQGGELGRALWMLAAAAALVLLVAVLSRWVARRSPVARAVIPPEDAAPRP
jgi:uncharacterized membrane protein YdjX (TVP38/TMEM64 family)